MLMLPIEKSKIPERFQMTFGDETWAITINYNSVTDVFTASLERLEDTNFVPIVMGAAITLGQQLWSVIIPDDLPAPVIIPLDISDKAERITFENFYKTVFLYIDDERVPLLKQQADGSEADATELSA